ncbi:MAG: DNA mismatch repair protein MutS [Bacteroidales bacterium]|nr:DNA mismatch repair protein MutS [Bacteroidales bacterium]MBQ5993395.1 DNA mismatch repair protein MutS [Bacteroidales bacterium]
MEKCAETPLMRQYNQFKAKHPDAILLFRVGDFYETYGEDAIKSSKILGITLTRHGKGASQTELAGFPHHALDTYLPRLVRAGYRVAICEQLEDPKLTKTLVKRGIIELVTPGVSINDKVLEQRENNFLAAIHLTDKQSGIAFLDISTGEFYIAEGNYEYLDKLFQNFKPMELVIQKGKTQAFKQNFGEKMLLTQLDDWVFKTDYTRELLTKHFHTKSLKGFGVEDLPLGIIAAGAALHYIYETQNHKIQHITKISRIQEDLYVWLDKFTIRNLELIHSSNENAVTLLDVLDETQTPMGSRMLRKWILMPLKEKSLIDKRLSVVEYLINNQDFTCQLTDILKQMGDLERMVSKIATGKINPREALQLATSLRAAEQLKALCEKAQSPILKEIADKLNPCVNVCKRIEKEIREDPPVVPSKGGIFQRGVNAELDELTDLATNSRGILADIQQREAEKTGINSLKIGFNNVFGYYLEVTNTYKSKVPAEWTRKQTLTGSERYITEELKELETKILTAQEKILEIEVRLYNELVVSLADYIPIIQNNARLAARLDVLNAFAYCAVQYQYTKPAISNFQSIDIKDGRHPVIERQLPPEEPYIANDIHLDTDKQQIIVITGPNMSGKSALLRQTALITLMAQMGCYVPARECTIGIVDKIFTRVGASDNISTGESTFMVEMNETANILNNVTNRSLVLLDEIGRGTSTYDGISIAWSIAEYLHENPLHHAKVLFATHYHELNDMAAQFPRIKNYHVSVKELDNKVYFLRKLEEGGSEHSFGIHVARMAGMPPAVLRRAEEILKQLEDSRARREEKGEEVHIEKPKDDSYQLSFINLDDPLLLEVKETIVGLDINSLTPVEALMKLNEIQGLLTGKKGNRQ